MKIVPPTAEGIEEAVEALKQGEVVAYPTETVYGLGVDPFSEAALERLYRVKARDPNNPVLLIIAGLAQLESVAERISPEAWQCIDAFWPGPLSLLLPKAKGVPDRLCDPAGRVCVRWTANAVAQALCEGFGGPITSTSANRSGEEAARSVEEIRLTGVSVAVDGGRLWASKASTVFDPESRRILREGAVPSEVIRRLFEG